MSSSLKITGLALLLASAAWGYGKDVAPERTARNEAETNETFACHAGGWLGYGSTAGEAQREACSQCSGYCPLSCQYYDGYRWHRIYGPISCR